MVRLIDDKDEEWESDTKGDMMQRREKATAERYIEGIAEGLDAIEAKVRDDKGANLRLHRKELTDYIESDIVLRESYARGVAKHNLKKDKEVSLATALFGDAGRYRAILASQDTERK